MPHPVDIYVGKKLRQRREIRGMPQKELARRLGISFQQGQKYESGANRVSASKLWETCTILDVEPDYFFEGLSRHAGGREHARAAAQEAQDAYDAQLPNARQVLDLNQNFQHIRDAKVRRQLVQLVKALAT